MRFDILLFSGLAIAGLTTEDETCNAVEEAVSAPLVDELLSIVPEGVVMDDYYVVDQPKSFPITSDMVGALVHLTFIHEGAGYRNSFGYFLFDDAVADTGVDAFDETFDAGAELYTVWDNASYYYAGGSGTCLSRGHTATIEIESDWEGRNLGFWVQANGYNNSRGAYWFTEDHLNKDGGLPHAVVLQTLTSPERLILGWEDLFRNSWGCDHDFNDLVLDIETTPPELITELISTLEIAAPDDDDDGDGVLNAVDDFPEDPDLAFDNAYPTGNRFYTVAFEDLYPSVGDGDYNDLIVAGRTHELTNADNEVAAMHGRFYTVARGAGYDHEFHLNIANAGPGTWTVTTYDADGEIVGVDGGQSSSTDLDLTLFASTKVAMKTYNTRTGERNNLAQGQWVAWTFDPTTAISPNDLEQAPYDPYIYVLNTGYEIHQINFPPVMDAAASEDETYRNGDGYPWVLVMPETWDHPEEKMLIDDAYPGFTTWRAVRGLAHQTWFRSPQASRVHPVHESFFIHDKDDDE